MNQAARPRCSGLWRATNLTAADRASHSLFLRPIFLGNIILRDLMRTNFPLILSSAPVASSPPVTPSVSNAAVKRTTGYGLWKNAGKRL